MPKLFDNNKGQVLLLVTTLLMILSLLCIAALILANTEKLTVKGSFEEAQANYVADAALEKVLAIVKVNVRVLDQLTLNKTYGKPQLESLLTRLAGQDLASVQGLIGLFNSTYTPPHNPVQATKPGTIQSISLTKTVQDQSGYQVRIEVTGTYGPARRSLVANVRISLPLNAFPGVLVQNTPVFSNTDMRSPLTVLTGVDFNGDSRFYNSIYIQGDCALRQHAKFIATGELVVLGNTIVDSDAQFDGEIKSTGDVFINGDVLGGPVRSTGSVWVGQGHVGHQVFSEQKTEWNGDIYATGTISPASSDNFGTAYPNTPQTISYSFPKFPLLDGPWYARNCDYYYAGDQILRAEDMSTGIYYIDGDVTISGNYQGNITLVASGTIAVPNSATLKAQDTRADSLLLMGLGDVHIHEQAQVEAIVYSKQRVILSNNAQLVGSLITANLDCRGAVVIHEPLISNTHPPWTTTDISILTWQEKYPVIPMD
ncbi:hypothetical protein SAMN02745133_00774 [Desulforamulus putei DSM 12395]|uniref:DUF7305 domain-containing protein n=1 Tax=Desulforamulus putei DSM 12395 TaxID=1121429 RepID=A0A1M4UVQ7_9FIRM|nr:polymer-forming cytoskeletal protein [Desulforamulus putei]SHE60680.1 hypothetical protein SAMN02745133_00774 [Desulforamulus putei DSM 12395]